MLSLGRYSRISGPLILFAALFLPGYLYQSAAGASLVFSNGEMLLQNLIVGAPQVLLILYVILTRGGADAHAFGLVRLRVSDLLKAIGVFVGICFLSIPIALAGRLVSTDGFVAGISIQLRPVSLILLVLVCITTGYREELFFRSYLLSELAPLGKIRAIAASTALFAIGHIYQGGLALLGTALIGVFLSLVFLRYRNAHVIALGHGLYNLAVVLIGATA
jgi:uncharacterized protein